MNGSAAGGAVPRHHQPAALLVQLLVQTEQRAFPAGIAGDRFCVVETHERELAVAGEDFAAELRDLAQRQIRGRCLIVAMSARAHRLQQVRLADRGRAVHPDASGTVVRAGAASAQRSERIDDRTIASREIAREDRRVAQPDSERQLLRVHLRRDRGDGG